MADIVTSRISEKDPEELILCLNGRLDSSNAAETEATLLSMQGATAHRKLTLDLQNLQYISSAGLRVVLKLRKSEQEMVLINVSADVYDVFDMTGFTEMMDVRKAYRVMDVTGCEVIGKGANGEVYRIDPETILKVYLNPDSLPDIQRERELARRAFVLGIPTAISYDVVRVGEGYGSVFELLNSDSFLGLLKKEPENLDKYIEMSVDLLKKIHSTEVKPDEMPDMKKVALGWVQDVANYLSGMDAAKLISLVSAVPDDNHMIHGDYHMKNVMMQNGEAILIDMDTLSHGNPIFEFAGIYNAYKGFSALDHMVVEHFLGITYETAGYIWKRTLELYFGTTDEIRLAEIEKKISLLSFARLLRRVSRHGTDNGLLIEETMDFYKNEITRLLKEVDSLIL